MKKKLMTALALILVVAMSVAGTYAYLTSTKTVTNTFTVGSVGITLDEAKVDVNGTKDESATARVTENTYKLMPGHEYLKDPTVHVTAGSEACYVFIEVKNDIKNIVFEGYETYIDEQTGEEEKEFIAGIETQITTGDKENKYKGNGWTPLTYVKDGKTVSVDGVYYKEVKNVDKDKGTDLNVFGYFKIKGDGLTNDQLAAYNNETITVNAYAIQLDGFENQPYLAWTTVKTASDNQSGTPAVSDAGTAEGGATGGDTVEG